MAFVFADIDNAYNKLDQDSQDLTKLINELDSLVADNVGNVKTWSSESAQEFLGRWRTFSEKFPTYINNFQHQCTIVKTAADAYRSAEGSN